MASSIIGIDLGDTADRAQHLLETGEYGSMDEVVQRAIRLLDHQQAAFDEMLRQKVQEALDDPGPSLPIDEAFAEVRRRAAIRRARAADR